MEKERNRVIETVREKKMEVDRKRSRQKKLRIL